MACCGQKLFKRLVACTLVLFGEKHLLNSSRCILHGSVGSMLLMTSNTGTTHEQIATSRTPLLPTIHAFSN